MPYSRAIDIGDGELIMLSGRPDKIVPSQKLIVDYKTTAKVPRSDEPYGQHKEQLNGYRWLYWPVMQAEKLRIQYIDMRRTKQIKVPLMELDEIEELLRVGTRKYVYALRTQTIPPGEYDSGRWECRYCDVVDLCNEINITEGGQSGKDRTKKTRKRETS